MAKLNVEIGLNEKDTSKVFIYTFTYDDGTFKNIKFSEESHEAIFNYFNIKPKREKKKPAPAPTLQEVKDYFKQEGYQEDTAIRFHKYYDSMDWFDGNNKPVLRWKAKCISTWMKPENKLKVEVKNTSSFFQQ